LIAWQNGQAPAKTFPETVSEAMIATVNAHSRNDGRAKIREHKDTWPRFGLGDMLVVMVAGGKKRNTSEQIFTCPEILTHPFGRL
jgi:hypothetical protein